MTPDRLKPLSAADRIISKRSANRQAEVLAGLQKLAREQREQRKLATEFERLQKEYEVERAAFKEIDARLGITASLEQLNTEILRGKGCVSSSLPIAFKEEYTSDQAFSAFEKSEKARQMRLAGEYNGAGCFKGEVPKGLVADRIRRVGVYKNTSVKLEWKSEGGGINRVKVSCNPSFAETPSVLVSGGGWDDEDYIGRIIPGTKSELV